MKVPRSHPMTYMKIGYTNGRTRFGLPPTCQQNIQHKLVSTNDWALPVCTNLAMQNMYDKNGSFVKQLVPVELNH